MTSVISLSDKRHYLRSTQTGILIAAMVSTLKNIALEKRHGLIPHHEA
jgi:hypothetical protein